MRASIVWYRFLSMLLSLPPFYSLANASNVSPRDEILKRRDLQLPRLGLRSNRRHGELQIGHHPSTFISHRQSSDHGTTISVEAPATILHSTSRSNGAHLSHGMGSATLLGTANMTSRSSLTWASASSLSPASRSPSRMIQRRISASS